MQDKEIWKKNFMNLHECYTTNNQGKISNKRGAFSCNLQKPVLESVCGEVNKDL